MRAAWASCGESFVVNPMVDSIGGVRSSETPIAGATYVVIAVLAVLFTAGCSRGSGVPRLDNAQSEGSRSRQASRFRDEPVELCDPGEKDTGRSAILSCTDRPLYSVDLTYGDRVAYWDFETSAWDVETVLSRLRDPTAHAYDRAMAARVLGRLGHPEVFDELLEETARLSNRERNDHGDDYLRVGLIRALADFGDHRAVPALIDLLSEDRICWEAWAMYRHWGGDSRLWGGVVRQALPWAPVVEVDSPAWKTRRRTTLPRLLPPFATGSVHIGGEAARALGLLRAREAVPALINVLSDAECGFRPAAAAAAALGCIGDRRALPALQQAMDPSGPYGLRQAARKALLQIESRTKPVAELTKDLQSQDAFVAFVAIVRLAESREPAAIPHLSELVKDTRSVRVPCSWMECSLAYAAHQAIHVIVAHPEDAPR